MSFILMSFTSSFHHVTSSPLMGVEVPTTYGHNRMLEWKISGWSVWQVGGAYDKRVRHMKRGWDLWQVGGAYDKWVGHKTSGWDIWQKGGTYDKRVEHMTRGWDIWQEGGTYDKRVGHMRNQTYKRKTHQIYFLHLEIWVSWDYSVYHLSQIFYNNTIATPQTITQLQQCTTIQNITKKNRKNWY